MSTEHRQRNGNDPRTSAVAFDFRRTDRIPKSQLRSIQVLHDNFARNLVTSLSGYLRSYVVVNLMSVEQLSYAEFLECLPSPTCVASLGVRPFDGNGVLELNPSLVFPVIEMLVGGDGKNPIAVQRELTEIELMLLDGVLQVILRDLTDAWKSIVAIDFSIDAVASDPKFLQVLAPGEAVVAIAIEIRIGEIMGMMNIAIPSMIIKMNRHKFDQQRTVRRAESTAADQSRVLKLILPSRLNVDARIEGSTLLLADLLQLETGDVLSLQCPVGHPISCVINGKAKFLGRVIASGRKLALVLENRIPSAKSKPASAP